MPKYVLDPRAFWLSLLDQPDESPWGRLGQAWRDGTVTLALSPGVMAMYMGPIQGADAEALGLSEAVLGKIGWLLRQRGDWYQPPAGKPVLGEPWDRLWWLARAAKADALLIADPDVAGGPHTLDLPVLTMPPAPIG